MYSVCKLEIVPAFYLVDVVAEIFPNAHKMVLWDVFTVLCLKWDWFCKPTQSLSANQILHANLSIEHEKRRTQKSGKLVSFVRGCV